MYRRRCTDVNEQRIYRNRLVAFLAFQDVRRQAPDPPPHLAAFTGAYRDGLCRKDPGVPPAQGSEMEESLFVDMVDDQTNLIQVSVQHHGDPRPAPPRHQQVSEHIGADLVGIGFDQRPQRLPDLVFETGHPKRIRQRLQQTNSVHGHHLRCGLVCGSSARQALPVPATPRNDSTISRGPQLASVFGPWPVPNLAAAFAVTCEGWFWMPSWYGPCPAHRRQVH